ncbi:MAG: hypothetical protein ACI35Q_07190 [Marinilabiliaceae bacterium]
MGNSREYTKSGGFSQYLYHQVGETITASNGVQGKIVTEYKEVKKFHSSLPSFSNTSKVYFKLDDLEKNVEQARVYVNRRAALDFDWGHTHGSYRKGIVHVHEWHKTKEGEWQRDSEPRLMASYEIYRYGEIIHLANPEARLLP